MATIRPTYSVEEVVLDLSDLETRFVLTTNQRKIRMAIVRSIERQLDAGIHFQSAICVNRVTDKALIAEYLAERDEAVAVDDEIIVDKPADLDKRKVLERLFDGGHRFVAMRRYLTKNPADKIKVVLHIYDNLPSDQEKMEYTLVNKGSKQTTNDVVQQYREDIPAYRWMTQGWSEKGVKREFAVDVSVYGGTNSVPFYRLVSAYFAARELTFSGGYMGTSFDFVREAQQLKIDDVRVMDAFMRDFLAAFGPVKGNSWLKTTPLIAIFRIWNENRLTIPQATMIAQFRSRIAHDAAAQQISRSGGFGATLMARGMFVTALNAGRRRNLFVVPTQPVFVAQASSVGGESSAEE